MLLWLLALVFTNVAGELAPKREYTSQKALYINPEALHGLSQLHLDWHCAVGCGFSGFLVEFLGLARALDIALPHRLALHSGQCDERFIGDEGLLFADERDVIRRVQARAKQVPPSSAAFRVSVVHGRCDENHVAHLRRKHGNISQGHLVIARVMTESNLLPAAGLVACAGAADDVWVPTRWHADQFIRAGFAPDSVAVIGEAVDGSLFARQANENSDESGAVRGEFTFLSTFKWEHRKGWDVLLRAYWLAFNATVADAARYARDDGVSMPELAEQIDRGQLQMPRPWPRVRLLLRAWKPSWEPGHADLSHEIAAFAQREYALAADQLPVVEWIGDSTSGPEKLSRDQMRATLAAADAFILATRGEGWGLPAAEAMTMGVPTIVTNFSGPTAYAFGGRDANALLIPVQHIGRKDGLAEPSVHALSQLMRHCVDNRAATAALASRARRHMLAHWSPGAVAGDILRRIRHIALRHRPDLILNDTCRG